MAVHGHLKNAFTEDEKYHNLMTWLNWATSRENLLLPYANSSLISAFAFRWLASMLKTKGNFTVFIIEYFYSCIDLIKIKYFS